MKVRAGGEVMSILLWDAMLALDGTEFWSFCAVAIDNSVICGSGRFRAFMEKSLNVHSRIRCLILMYLGNRILNDAVETRRRCASKRMLENRLWAYGYKRMCTSDESSSRFKCRVVEREEKAARPGCIGTCVSMSQAKGAIPG